MRCSDFAMEIAIETEARTVVSIIYVLKRLYY